MQSFSSRSDQSPQSAQHETGKEILRDLLSSAHDVWQAPANLARCLQHALGPQESGETVGTAAIGILLVRELHRRLQAKGALRSTALHVLALCPKQLLCPHDPNQVPGHEELCLAADAAVHEVLKEQQSLSDVQFALIQLRVAMGSESYMPPRAIRTQFSNAMHRSVDRRPGRRAEFFSGQSVDVHVLRLDPSADQLESGGTR